MLDDGSRGYREVLATTTTTGRFQRSKLADIVRRDQARRG